MSLQVESLFTAALGLQAPWKVAKVDLDAAKHRIDFEVVSTAKRLDCPSCGAADQGVHDRIRRDWRHLDFFEFEAWLHADIPRIGCTACGKTTQVAVPWAREGSGFTLLFEALALTLCQGLPVRQAAKMLRVRDKQLWGRIEHYVTEARRKQDMSKVSLVGIDETNRARGSTTSPSSTTWMPSGCCSPLPARTTRRWRSSLKTWKPTAVSARPSPMPAWT